MKLFINNNFMEAIACAGAKIREDHYEYIESIFDEITPYGWECHDRVYGFCYNPIQ